MIATNLISFKELLMKCAVPFLLFVTSAVNAQGPAHPNDPLSLDEISKASVLLSAPQVSARTLGEEVSSFANNTQEVLLVERNEEKGAPRDQRRADVYIYNYSTNELIQSVVDLNTSEVIRSERKQGVQLPMTSNEIKRVKEIVFEDEDERAIIEEEYFRITSRKMTDITDLNVKTFTFSAANLPNRVNEASKQCGIHRCAQLMLYTSDNVVFEISPIVNLSVGVVTQRIGF